MGLDVRLDKWAYDIEHPDHEEPVALVTAISSPDLPTTVEMHLEVYKWSHNILYYLVEWWGEYLEYLKERGVKNVMTIGLKTDKRLVKLWRLFGFTLSHEQETTDKPYMVAELEV